MSLRTPFSVEETKSMWKFFVQQLRKKNFEAIKCQNSLWRTYYIESSKKGIQLRHSYQALEKHFRIMLPQIVEAPLENEDIILILQTSRIILNDPRIIKRLEKRLNCVLEVESNGYIKKVIVNDFKKPNLEKEANSSNFLESNVKEDNSAASINIQIIENENEKPKPKKIKIEVADENDEKVEDSNEALVNKLRVALSNLPSRNQLVAKPSLQESLTMPDQIPSQLFITEQVNKKKINKSKEEEMILTKEEKNFYETFSNYNWIKMKPSNAENFKKFLQLRIKMILNGELKPEEFFKNIPRHLCAKINKIPEALVWIME